MERKAYKPLYRYKDWEDGLMMSLLAVAFLASFMLPSIELATMSQTSHDDGHSGAAAFILSLVSPFFLLGIFNIFMLMAFTFLFEAKSRNFYLTTKMGLTAQSCLIIIFMIIALVPKSGIWLQIGFWVWACSQIGMCALFWFIEFPETNRAV